MLKEKRERQSRLMDGALIDKIESVADKEPESVYAPKRDDLFDLFDEIDRAESLIETGKEPVLVKNEGVKTQGFGLMSVFLLAFMSFVFIGLCVGAYILY